MKRPDVVIVGAGSAGCVVARRCAEMRLNTFLLDRKPRELIGQKVCGDEVSKSHFDAIGISYPMDAEVASAICGADVYPPSLRNEMKVRGWEDFDGWTLQRFNFGQRLLADALRAGVRLETECHVAEPLLSNDQVVGVTYKKSDSTEPVTVRAGVVVDASGFAGVIRNKLDSPFVEKQVDKADIALCYREIIKLKMPLAEPEIARVFLGGKVAPSGYAWVFPKGPQVVNAGIGICGGSGRGSPRAYLQAFREEYPLFYGCEVVEGAGGAVPVRRPLKSLVADGVAFVGDAALQVNPIHGGGIGPGMRAATILGEVIKEAVAQRDTSTAGLWDYNVRFMSGFGRRLAALEVFRRLLQQVADDDLEFGFLKRVLEPKDLIDANHGDGISLSVFAKMRRVKRAARRPGLLMKLQKAASLMKKIDRLYAHYPLSTEGFEKWNQSVIDQIGEADFSS